MKPLHRFTVLPTVPDALTPLRVLAHNLRWSWHPATQELFRTIDPAGSSSPVNILPPYLVMNYYIAVTGLYPTID